jgi:hypothetical protein
MAVEIISTVLIAATATPPAGPYDLTDLATVRDELSIPATDTANNAFLSRGITQVSTAIANYCNRVFQVETLQDQIFIEQDPYPYQVPGGVYPLQLSRWPLVNTKVVSFTGNTHGSTLVDGIASTAGLTAGLLVFAADGSLPSGTEIEAVVDANSITLTNAATSSETGLAFTTGVQVVQTLSVGDTQTLIYGKDFTIDAARGWLIRLNSWTGISERWEAEPVTVQYQAGYATVPADLVDATLRLVTARFRAKGRDPMLVEQTQGANLGTQRYWVGNTPGQRGAFAPEIAGLIDQYRVPVIA